MNTPKNIEELFNRLNKQTPFTVPEGYFEELEEKVMLKVKQENNAEKAEIPFEVPQGYFDGLADKVMERVEDKPAKVLSIWRKPMTVAASVAVLLMVSLGIYYIKLPNKPSQTAEISFDGIPTEDLYAAIQEEVDMDLVAEVLMLDNTSTETNSKTGTGSKEDSLKKENQQGKTLNDKTKALETDQLEEYLIENIDDLYIDEI